MAYMCTHHSAAECDGCGWCHEAKSGEELYACDQCGEPHFEEALRSGICEACLLDNEDLDFYGYIYIRSEAREGDFYLRFVEDLYTGSGEYPGAYVALAKVRYWHSEDVETRGRLREYLDDNLQDYARWLSRYLLKKADIQEFDFMVKKKKEAAA